MYKKRGESLAGRFHHVHDDVLCMVLCVVLVIELLSTHSLTVVVSALDAAQHDSKETLKGHNQQL